MNIHFSELLLILLVALLVIKPERLPEVAFKLGRFVHWVRHSISKIKTEIDKPLQPNQSDHSSS